MIDFTSDPDYGLVPSADDRTRSGKPEQVMPMQGLVVAVVLSMFLWAGIVVVVRAVF